MSKVIYLEDEEVKIVVSEFDTIFEKQGISLEGAIIKCIKHVYRYGEFTMPKNIMISILWSAHKGEGCKESHLDITQRISLYEYFQTNPTENPYIQEFMKVTKELLRC